MAADGRAPGAQRRDEPGPSGEPGAPLFATEPGAAGGTGPRWRRSIRAWAERNGLGCFFGLTYALSWTIWLTEPLLERYDPIGSQWYGQLAPYGPTLAALVIVALTDPVRLPPLPLARRLLPAALTLGLAAWANWDQLATIGLSPHPAVAGLLWLALTLLPAWVILMAGARLQGVRTLLGSLTRWRHPLNSYLLALLLVPVAGLAGIIVLKLLGAPWPVFPQRGPAPAAAYDLLFVFVATVLYGGGLGEEPGWRGFALPRLQERFSPLTASVVLSIAWSLWFIPLHVVAAHSDLPLAQTILFGFATRLFTALPVMIVYTWFANRTGGSLLLLAFLHASVNNTTGWWLPVTTGLYLGTFALAPILVVLDRMWRRRQ